MYLPTLESNLCVNLPLFSRFQLPCSRSRTNLASPTNEGNAGPIHIGNSADTAAPRATGVNRGQSLTVNANGVRDKRTRTLSPVAAVTLSLDALVAQPTTVAASEAESAHEEEVDGKTAAVLIVPSEAPQDKRRKKRRGRDDATNSISGAAADAEPIFS